jgi:hypothetical protein
MTSPCGTDTPVREPMAAEINEMKMRVVQAVITRSCALLVAALREIFEESAYQRFLARAQVESSPAAYSDFLRENEADRARRPKCC